MPGRVGERLERHLPPPHRRNKWVRSDETAEMGPRILDRLIIDRDVGSATTAVAADVGEPRVSI